MINYTLLTKPGILMGNLVTLVAGFLLATQGEFKLLLFLATVVGLGCVMASGCVFNNYIDREIDKKMVRTQKRALVTGVISNRRALVFALLLGVMGSGVLFLFTNMLTLGVALFGFFVYVVLYSLWKGKTVYGTAIGSIAGGVPPVVGYCAATEAFDGGALLLFMMMVLWQMPHFFSIAIYRLQDYAAAKIPVLPLERGMMRTKIHMVAYIVAFMGSAFLLTHFGYTGRLYLIVTLVLAIVWLFLGVRGFRCSSNEKWARKMFVVSLVVIMGASLAIPFSSSRSSGKILSQVEKPSL